MINGCKVAALCVSEIQNENTQSMIYPMYQSLLEKNWRCLIYNTATDLFRDTPFDRGEASVFQLMDFSVVDVVIVYTQCLKCRAIVEDILAAASQHQVPVFLVEPTERYSSGIRITFDELDAFPVEKAFRILEESSGSHFDPKIVGTFLAHKEEVTQVLLKYQDVHI